MSPLTRGPFSHAAHACATRPCHALTHPEAAVRVPPVLRLDEGAAHFGEARLEGQGRGKLLVVALVDAVRRVVPRHLYGEGTAPSRYLKRHIACSDEIPVSTGATRPKA